MPKITIDVRKGDNTPLRSVQEAQHLLVAGRQEMWKVNKRPHIARLGAEFFDLLARSSALSQKMYGMFILPDPAVPDWSVFIESQSEKEIIRNLTAWALSLPGPQQTAVLTTLLTSYCAEPDERFIERLQGARMLFHEAEPGMEE